MDQAGIIRDLLVWLEGHLDQPLSLDNVAAKAGYSKWHLQRMFKEHTGYPLGEYIRVKKLKKSADRLTSTDEPILNVAISFKSSCSRLWKGYVINCSRTSSVTLERFSWKHVTKFVTMSIALALSCPERSCPDLYEEYICSSSSSSSCRYLMY